MTDQRTTMYAALAFGGFMDAAETERVTLWAARRIERLEEALRHLVEAEEFAHEPAVAAAVSRIAERALDSDALDEERAR